MRILILTLDLKYLDHISLNFNPTTLQVTKKIICINGACFYDMNTKTLKKQIFVNYNAVSLLNSLFYVCDHSSNKISCYDEEGVLVDEIDIDRIKESLKWHWDGMIRLFNGHIIMTSYTKNEFLQLSF